MSTGLIARAEATVGQGLDQQRMLSLAAMNRRRAARAYEIAAHLHAELGHWEQAADAKERARSEHLAYERAVRSAA